MTRQSHYLIGLVWLWVALVLASTTAPVPWWVPSAFCVVLAWDHFKVGR